MLKQFDYKAPNGKLLRLKIDFNEKSRQMNSIRIAGDFFIHPEESIALIEGFFKGKNISGATKAELDAFIQKNKIQVIGFTPEDLLEAIRKVLE